MDWLLMAIDDWWWFIYELMLAMDGEWWFGFAIWPLDHVASDAIPCFPTPSGMASSIETRYNFDEQSFKRELIWWSDYCDDFWCSWSSTPASRCAHQYVAVAVLSTGCMASLCLALDDQLPQDSAEGQALQRQWEDQRLQEITVQMVF